MSTGTVTMTATGNSTAVAKNPNENYETVTIVPTAGATAYSTLTFTIQASMDGTNYEQIAAIDNKTGLLVAGGTSIVPSDGTARTYSVPLAQNYTKFRVNVGAIAAGSADFIFNGAAVEGSSLYSSIAGAAGSFTNLTASGTLGVTGLTTLTGGAVAPDSATIALGTGSDLLLSWDGTRFSFTQAATNSEMRYGVDGAGIDQMWYGDTASAYMNWDQSADTLIFGGASSCRGMRANQSTAVAMTGATTLVLADTGGIFNIDQDAAFDIDLPSPTDGAGRVYTFFIGDAGANNVTITVDGSAATFLGTIVNDVTSVIPATGSTITFASGTAALGDTVIVRSVSTTLYHVQAVCSAAGGITIA